MIRFRCPLAFVAVFALALPLSGTAQTAAQSSAKNSAQTSARSPLLVMCEGDGCSRWEFHSGQATATFADGAVASLTIVDFPFAEAGKVTIPRADTSGVGKGIVGTYSGTRRGPIFEGALDWKWPGHPDGHADWDPKSPSLLDFAEACDVPVRWSCRTGVCHMCESGLISGEVNYQPDPLDPPAQGNLLICCSQPAGDIVLDL